MKKTTALALAMALVSAAQATPPSRTAPAVNKTLSNAVPATQAGNTSAAPVQAGSGNAAAPGENQNHNWVCPPGIKPGQNGANGQCFPRPTRSVQK